MPADSFSRKTARDALATVLTTELNGLVQQVFGYKPASIQAAGKGPAVAVWGGPIDRERAKLAGSYDNHIQLMVTIYVIWHDYEAGWSESDCEDKQDLLEKKVADAVLNHKSKAQDPSVPWDTLYITGPSSPDSWTEGGVQWWTETLTIMAEKING